jgi:hypothetical protein
MRKVSSWVPVLAVFLSTVGVGCSSDAPPASGSWDAGPVNLTDAGALPGPKPDATARGPERDAATDSAAPKIRFTESDAGPLCTGLSCQQTCASTTVSGKVYDPAGVNGLYNVFVYVPNAPLDPIDSGPKCTPCQAPASGDPITSTTTLPDGSFKLTNVPDGSEIPIVLQLGKWRRHLTIPAVSRCTDNTPPDGFFRLPRKQHETSADDNIPLIAFTTGCDGAECFFVGRVGIDESEFTGPTGTGRVHVYKSKNDDGQTFPGGAGDANTFWSTASEWMKYDMVFDACECSPFDRGGAGTTNVGYTNFLAYLNAGGRAFTTHFFYNFYASQAECSGDVNCEGQGALPTVGEWEGNQGESFATDSLDCPNDATLDTAGQGGSCLTIDTTIPKGVAFADWYADHNAELVYGGGERYGYVGLTDIREDMGELDPSLLAAGTATPWLYAGDVTGAYDAYYFSFNTPVGTNPATQCGRATFSDVHLDDAPPSATFPSYCPTDPNSSDHAPNELALEFLLFDLSSCVQDDRLPPPPPPTPPR